MEANFARQLVVISLQSAFVGEMYATLYGKASVVPAQLRLGCEARRTATASRCAA